MSIYTKLVINGILMILILITGVWVHALGRPVSTGVLTLHKLIALAFTIYCMFVLISYGRTIHAGTAFLVLLVIAGLSILGLFATGAVLSFDKPVNRLLLLLHSYMPVVTILSLAAAVLLLIRKRAV